AANKSKPSIAASVISGDAFEIQASLIERIPHVFEAFLEGRGGYARDRLHEVGARQVSDARGHALRNDALLVPKGGESDAHVMRDLGRATARGGKGLIGELDG
ncbi:MAG TPA: hypothetical protein VG963_07910, partial [Polyangiaceae bacterium]|nr:hypothetical protein [Polyangiaceae bacterium]